MATDPLSKEKINVMAGHLRNLLTPATPYFFNTMCGDRLLSISALILF